MRSNIEPSSTLCFRQWKDAWNCEDESTNRECCLIKTCVGDGSQLFALPRTLKHFAKYVSMFAPRDLNDGGFVRAFGDLLGPWTEGTVSARVGDGGRCLTLGHGFVGSHLFLSPPA